MRIFVIVFAGLVAAGGTAAQTPLSETQKKLARDIGAVISLIDRCKIVPYPASGISAALKAGGLSESALEKGSAFYEIMLGNIRLLTGLERVYRENGRSESDLQSIACKQLSSSFGPRGADRPGLIPMQK